MAIPIAEGTINKQFQAPGVAQGRAVDLSQNIQQMGQQTINAIQSIQQFSNAQEEMTANDAITLYSTQMNNLNLELRSKKGLDAVNFESEYKKKASQYHSEFINRLGGLNSNVQNSAVNKINSFNTSNKNEFVLYTEGQRLEAEQQSSDAAKAALNSLHLSQFDNTLVDNKAVFYDCTAALDELVLKDATRVGMAGDSAYVLNKQMQERTAFAKQVIQKLNRQGDYRRSMQFVEDIKGQIPESDRQSIGHDASYAQLNHEVLVNPSAFINDDGTIKKEYVNDKYFPYLEQEERDIVVKAANKLNKEYKLSAETTMAGQALADALQDSYFQRRMELGMLTDAEVEAYVKRSTPAGIDIKKAKADFLKQQIENRKKRGTTANLLRLLSEIDRDGKRSFVFVNGQRRELKTNEEINQAKKAGLEIVTNIHDMKQGNKYGLADYYNQINPLIRTLFVELLDQSGKPRTIIQERPALLEEYAVGTIFAIAKQNAGNDLSLINTKELSQAFIEFEKKFNKKAGEYQAKKGILISLDGNAGDLFSDSSVKKLVDNCLSEAMTETFTYDLGVAANTVGYSAEDFNTPGVIPSVFAGGRRAIGSLIENPRQLLPGNVFTSHIRFRNKQ